MGEYSQVLKASRQLVGAARGYTLVRSLVRWIGAGLDVGGTWRFFLFLGGF
jgi:hypothetical protein